MSAGEGSERTPAARLVTVFYKLVRLGIICAAALIVHDMLIATIGLAATCVVCIVVVLGLLYAED